jgi:hypothetical protein
MLTFNECEREWNTARGEFGVLARPAVLSHVVTARDLAEQLARLAIATEDPRFVAAGKAMIEHRLVDTSGTWERRIPATPFDAMPATEVVAVAAIDSLVRQGASLRLSCARVAAGFDWPANSFDAAVKQLERAWRQRTSNGKELVDIDAFLRASQRAGRRVPAIIHDLESSFGPLIAVPEKRLTLKELKAQRAAYVRALSNILRQAKAACTFESPSTEAAEIGP